MEYTEQNTQNYLTLLECDLLQAGGVDNWSFYDQAMDEYIASDDEVIDASNWLNALEMNGVDNWEFYELSLDGLSEYEDYLQYRNSDLDFYEWKSTVRNQNVTSEVESTDVVTEKITVYESESYLREILYGWEDNYGNLENIDGLVSLIWKRSTFPKIFDKTISHSDGNIESIRLSYVKKLVDTKEFHNFLKQHTS